MATTQPVSNGKSTQDKVSVDVDSLIIGRAIRFPIHDQSGVLLLSEGAVISDVFKQKLRDRDIMQIQVHANDASLISSKLAAPAPEAPKPTPPRDNDVDAKLKKVIDDGLQFVTNEGPAAREAVKFHGAESYNHETQSHISKKSQEQCATIKSLMNSTQSAKALDGLKLRDSITNTLSTMCEDFDCVNASALHLSEDTGLSERCYRMAVLGMSIAVEMGLNDENVCRIGITGMLHDWGMLKIREEIRNPVRPLTYVEKLERQKHVMHSVDMLEKIKGLPTLVSLVSYQIHEQMDGSGYPRGRRGTNIHLFARILNVADAYVELTSAYPFRDALSPYDATRVILQGVRQGKYDSNVVRGMLRAQSLFPVGSIVMLSSGKMARVLRANGDRFTEPIVQLIQDEAGKPLSSSEEEDHVLNIAESEFFVTQALPILHGPEPIPAPHFLKNPAILKKRQSQTETVSVD
ncbi:MAG: HD domain-containing protein [Planctomycetaceae bacterium]|nr:HD domain-containing protein [Planctomycetaceae bacterium]